MKIFTLWLLLKDTEARPHCSLRRITDFEVAEAFTIHSVFTYGAPNTLLTDNRKQFIFRLMLETHRILDTKELFTTTYDPQTSRQTERMNRTLCEALQKFISEHPKDWNLYTDIITYSYNNQCHESTGMSPFEHVLSRTMSEWHTRIPTDRSQNLLPRETKPRWVNIL